MELDAIAPFQSEASLGLPRAGGLARTTLPMSRLLNLTEGTAASAGGPVYLLLFPVCVVCFVAALVTDLAYAVTAYLMWLHFSEWLIAAGVTFGILALLVLLIEFLAGRAVRAGVFGWTHLLLLLATLVVEAFNALVHTRDGWTAVVPSGLALSVVGALCALLAVATLFRVPVAWVQPRRALR
jgi:uncharacterized membrane protein